LGRLLRFSILPRLSLLEKIALAVAILLHGLAGRLDSREKIFDRVPTLLANLVTEFKTFDLAHAAYTDSVLVCATATRTWRRHDSSRVVVLGRLIGRVLNDVLGKPMGPLF
jgi:hypothetical protein